ncbi:hypothetical protein KDW_51190 [Dictyobacter vulcani]|uniref:Uncharacterized protein n=1 Tax=Dictyobacter vulcani TaxID=2607529 RepID=A0A5J4KWQ5_9CHLR|nr:hypothetical protein [Dictyobacter vulcani]GER90957.1 hypothetical protein KDW_51190 [Dictyobacter vulcani]
MVVEDMVLSEVAEDMVLRVAPTAYGQESPMLLKHVPHLISLQKLQQL